MIAPALIVTAGMAVLAGLVFFPRPAGVAAARSPRENHPEPPAEQHRLDLDRVAAYANGTRKLLLLDTGRSPTARADWHGHRAHVERLLNRALAAAGTVPLHAAELRRDCGSRGAATAQYWDIPHGAAVLRVLRDLLDAGPDAHTVPLGPGLVLLLDY